MIEDLERARLHIAQGLEQVDKIPFLRQAVRCFQNE